MGRYFFRIGGLLFLLVGIAVGLIDGTRSIAADRLDLTSFGEALNWFFPDRMIAVQETISKNLHPFIWDPFLTTILPLPAIFLFFSTGTVFLGMERNKLRD